MVEVPVRWPGDVCPHTTDEMRTAFAALAAQLYTATEDEGMPAVYEAQQAQLNGAMQLMNSQFAKLLKYYALRHARDAFSPSEELLQATLTQLTFEGLCLELETVDLASSLGEESMVRRKVT